MRVAAVVVTAALAVIVWGGYSRGWRWTGLSSEVTLWDWLQVLALPIALAVGPLLWRHRLHMTRRHHSALAGTVMAFAAIVCAGYLVPLAWTGFGGNTLWDWLELALLPLVVASVSLWAGSGTLRRVHLASGVLLAVAFFVLVTCGYLVPWSWTGFTGNTVWDWIKLLLLPVLVPTVLVPAVTARLTDRLAPAGTRTGVS